MPDEGGVSPLRRDTPAGAGSLVGVWTPDGRTLADAVAAAFGAR